MKKGNLTLTQLQNEVNNLSLRDMRKLITSYLKENGGQMDKRYTKLVLSDLEERLKELGINKTCPKCGSILVVNNGKRENGIQRLKCTACDNRFTYFTNTILEKTKFHWDMWIDLIYYMIHDFSIFDTTENLIQRNNCIGLKEQTVINWRHKILEACAQMEQPILAGTVQIDETHFRESQKGSLNLINLYDSNAKRYPRRKYKASKYGVMGTEFTTVITAIDSSQHIVMKVAGLGKFDMKTFERLFRQHIKNISFLATDANNVYTEYATKYCINHYVRPSNYVDLIDNKTDAEKENLYNNNKLDYISNNMNHRYTYNQLEELKLKHGLSLSLVNGLHSELKRSLNGKLKGISSKHLNGYIAWKALLKNYRADNNLIPASTRDDAEKILCMILESQKNPLLKELRKKSINDLEKPNKSFLKNLKKNTDEARQKGRPGFIFNSEDISNSFSIEKLLDEMPVYRLKELAKKCKIKGYTKIDRYHKYKYIQELKKIPNIRDLVLEMCAKYGKTTSDEKKL